MKYEVKIILYPDIHKSKNGEFFERLMYTIFSQQGYELDQNVNFTGLEIDLYGKHKHRDETLLIECKAKQRPDSNEVTKFLFNILTAKKADYGYFIHTEELIHHAAGLKDEWTAKKDESKKFTFLGPKKIIEILTDANRIKPFSIDKPDTYTVEKLILAYTYFGIYYIAITNTGSSQTNSFYIFDASTMEEKTDLSLSIEDESLVEVAFEKIIKEAIVEIKTFKHIVSTKQTETDRTTCPEISEKFIEWLENPGANFTHPQTSDLRLDDIFVYPDLVENSLKSFSKKSKHAPFLNLSAIANTTTETGIKYVFIGNETSGKTTICKRLFIDFYNQGYLPVFIEGQNLSNNLRIEIFEKTLKKCYQEQYQEDICPIDKINISKVIIIIDDFHKIKIKNDYRAVLIKNICSKFCNLVITGNALMPLEGINNKVHKDIFKDFMLYSIQEFGTKLRYELISKWNTVGREKRFIDTNELLRQNDFANNHINSIIGNNYIPSYPIYLLGMLQALEAGSNLNSSNNYSQHGFYYELVINEALNKAVKDKKEISLYVNYITNFCYFLFEKKSKGLTISEFNDFHILYCDRHDIKNFGTKTILKVFEDAKLFVINSYVSVNYKFVYYYFVAKYMTNNISKQETKIIISKMVKRLYREEFSNIILFLTHLSKDPFIIDELVSNAKTIFEKNDIAKLDSDVDNINALIKELPKQVIENIDIHQHREDELEEQQEIERLENEYEQGIQDDGEFDLDEAIDAIDLLARVTLALKNIEILGQVAKKYWGEMTGDIKYEVVSETYNLGLRTLNNYLSFMEDNSEMLIPQIANLIDKKFIKDKFKLEKRVEDLVSDFIFRLCFLASFGIIRRVSNSIGYEGLEETLNKVLIRNPINSVRLIDLSIKLEHFSKLPIDRIEQDYNDFSNNKLASMALRNLVINYMYMFETDYRQKAQLSRILGIEMQTQYVIDQTSKIKKKE